MSPTWLDDVTIERIVAGDEVDAHLQHLAVFARAVEALGDEPVPAASPALEALFATAGARRTSPTSAAPAAAGLGDIAAGGEPAAPSRSRRRRRRVLTEGLSTAAARIAALGVAAKIGLGTAVAAAGVAGAGAAGALPDQANDRVRGMIEAVTPVDFGDGHGTAADGEGPGGGTDEGRFGDRVSDDATGTSDGENGVDGDRISGEAPGARHRPDSSGPGATGLDRVDETPADDNAPDEPGEPGQSGSGGAGPGSDDRPSTPPSTTPTPPSTTPSPGTVPPQGGE